MNFLKYYTKPVGRGETKQKELFSLLFFFLIMILNYFIHV